MIRLLIAAVTLVISAPAGAQPLKWMQLFEVGFNRFYEESRCQQNILKLLHHGQSQGLNLSDIQVVEILNPGISNFGMVGAKQNRRGRDSNWFHHVIAVSGDRVLDFDFTGEPKLLPWVPYLKAMFTTPKMLETEKRCLSEIGSYEFRFYSGEAYYLKNWARRTSSAQVQTIKLRDAPTWNCRALMGL